MQEVKKNENTCNLFLHISITIQIFNIFSALRREDELMNENNYENI